MSKLLSRVSGVFALLTLSSLAFAESLSGIPAEVDGARAARAQLEAMRSRRDEVAIRVSDLEAQQASVQQRLMLNSRALYRLSRSGLLPISSGLEGLLAHASRLQRLERAVRLDLRDLTGLRSEEQGLRSESTTLERDLAAHERRVAELERAHIAQLSRQVEQNLRGEYTIRSAHGSGDRMNYGLSVVGGVARGRFVEQRGNLALPVSGPSSIQDATRAESGGPGLEFLGKHGAPVRAAAAGRVAFADRYGSYGELVIIDHGDRYYTVYGGFATVEVQVGDELSKSARLGTAGSSAIYFEVRRGTKTEDARPWLGL